MPRENVRLPSPQCYADTRNSPCTVNLGHASARVAPRRAILHGHHRRSSELRCASLGLVLSHSAGELSCKVCSRRQMRGSACQPSRPDGKAAPPGRHLPRCLRQVAGDHTRTPPAVLSGRGANPAAGRPQLSNFRHTRAPAKRPMAAPAAQSSGALQSIWKDFYGSSSLGPPRQGGAAAASMAAGRSPLPRSSLPAPAIGAGCGSFAEPPRVQVPAGFDAADARESGVPGFVPSRLSKDARKTPSAPATAPLTASRGSMKLVATLDPTGSLGLARAAVAGMWSLDEGGAASIPAAARAIAGAWASTDAEDDDCFGEHGEHLPLASLASPLPLAAGLRNVGNTCFLAATLQCLASLGPFAGWLLPAAAAASLSDVAKPLTPVLRQLGADVLDLKRGGRSFEPRTASILARLGPGLSLGRQHDAHEFFTAVSHMLARRVGSALPRAAPLRGLLASAVGGPRGVLWYTPPPPPHTHMPPPPRAPCLFACLPRCAAPGYG